MSENARVAAYIVLKLCATPLAWPVVPEVYTIWATSSAPGDLRSATGCRCSHGVSTKNSMKPIAPVREGVRSRLQQPFRIVNAVIGIRHHAGARLGGAQQVLKLAAAERRNDRCGHRAQPGAGQVQRRQHPPVRQVNDDDVTAADAEFQQRPGESVDGLRELTIGQGPGMGAVLIRDDTPRPRPLLRGPPHIVEESLLPPPAPFVELSAARRSGWH